MPDEEDMKLLRSGEIDLSRCDFRGADLQGMDLRGRDFTEALFNKADLSNTDLRGANLSKAQFSQTNLSGANLSGQNFQHTLLMNANLSGANLTETVFPNDGGKRQMSQALHNVNFTGCDIRGANFRYINFNGNCRFENVQVDSRTDFEGAHLLRAQARLPAFADYDFSHGALHRRQAPATSVDADSESQKISEEDRSKPLDESGAVSAEGDVVPAVAAPEVADGYSSIGDISKAYQLTQGLSARIKQDLEALSAQKPNEPQALAVYEEYVDLLNHIIVQLGVLADVLDGVKHSTPDQVIERLSYAENILTGLGQMIVRWSKESGDATFKFGINVGALGLSTVFLTALGVSPDVGFGVASFLLGGKDIVGVFSPNKKDE